MTDEEFTVYWGLLVTKKYSTKETLSSDERLFFAANDFRGSVPRSGLVGYFENTECDVISDAHSALATLGLSEALKLLQDGQNIVLKGNPLPETDQCLTLFDKDLAEETLDQPMNELDESVKEIERQLYLQDDLIFDVLCRFADERALGAPT
ncbi:MAG: DMP19 family protein [Planctomycetia bacterium]